MNLHAIDIAIILAYLGTSVFVGYWVSKRASRDIKSYFLGGNVMPWYVLGISDASGMFDIAGTMWLVYIMFVYGLKSLWIPWLWPVFNQIFLAAYLSRWLRRSGAMTGADWIRTRFGTGRGADLSHLIVVVFALVSVVAFLSYAFKGIGKFAVDFLPWHMSANQYALILMAITAFYVVKGGMFSVVITEVIQFCILSTASITLGIIAMREVSAEALAKAVPAGWDNIWFGWHLDLDWSQLMPSVTGKIGEDGYSLFGLFFMMLLLKGTLVSAAGPAPNYDMQRILSTRSPREASLMNAWVNVVLIFPRYFLITGLTILALVFYSDTLKTMGNNLDFEMILPYTLNRFVPAGLMGLLIAGLLAAFMSNFAATVNAAPPYIVNDIYKRFINPHASEKTYVRMSYASSLGVVVLGIAVGWFVESIDVVIKWIVAALWGGYTASNVLKWYWWRFNGYGYFWGMVAGILASMVLPFALPSVSALNSFPIILVHRPRRLRRRHAGDAARRRRGAEDVLPAGAAVGLLGADPEEGAGRGSDVPAESGLRPRHVQHRRRDRVADEPGGAAGVLRDPQVGCGAHRARDGAGGRGDPEVHLVRQPRRPRGRGESGTGGRGQ